jgi:hypothetical protein
MAEGSAVRTARDAKKAADGLQARAGATVNRLQRPLHVQRGCPGRLRHATTATATASAATAADLVTGLLHTTLAGLLPVFTTGRRSRVRHALPRMHPAKAGGGTKAVWRTLSRGRQTRAWQVMMAWQVNYQVI